MCPLMGSSCSLRSECKCRHQLTLNWMPITWIAWNVPRQVGQTHASQEWRLVGGGCVSPIWRTKLADGPAPVVLHWAAFEVSAEDGSADASDMGRRLHPMLSAPCFPGSEKKVLRSFWSPGLSCGPIFGALLLKLMELEASRRWRGGA